HLPFFITPLPPPSTLFPYTTLFRSQCLQFRPEQEALSTTAVIQGFNSEPIADEVKFAVFRVPEREGKHPDKGLDCPFESPCLNRDRKSTRLNSSHLVISYAVFCLKK